MKPHLLVFASVAVGMSLPAYSQDETSSVSEAGASETNAIAVEAPTQEELEAKFTATLTNATMAGRWYLIRDGKLTPEKEDRYEIKGVSKTLNGSWLISARIQYGKFDMVLPVPVKVEWAGDTPVIIVDKMGLPGGNLYSARVVIHDDSYAGTWSGGEVRGLMNGMITRESPGDAEEKEKEEGEAGAALKSE